MENTTADKSSSNKDLRERLELIVTTIALIAALVSAVTAFNARPTRIDVQTMIDRSISPVKVSGERDAASIREDLRRVERRLERLAARCSKVHP